MLHPPGLDRVDLTPFAGMLSDGDPHTVSISVYNTNSYFLATANLLLYRDKFRAETGGAVEENTLSDAPVPDVEENLTTANGATTGNVIVGSTRTFTIKGYVNTSRGRVETTVNSTVDFNSNQAFNVATVGVPEIQNVNQTSTVDSTTTTQLGILAEKVTTHWSFPLLLTTPSCRTAMARTRRSSVQTSSTKWPKHLPQRLPGCQL